MKESRFKSEPKKWVWTYQDGHTQDGQPRYQADIYDLTLKDEYGGPMCVAAGVDSDIVNKCWNQYLATRGNIVETDYSQGLKTPAHGLEP